MKISGFFDEVSSNLDTQIKTAKELNVNYICPRNIDGKNISDYTLEEFENNVKPRLDAAGVSVSSLGTPFGKIALDDEEGYANQKAKLTELVKIAKLCNCKYIRVFSFYKHSENLQKVVERLKGFIDIAAPYGITLIHENEKHVFGDIPTRCKQLYDALGGENFALCYDAANYIQVKVDAMAAYEMLKDCTVYYHIKDADSKGVNVPLGMGLADYGTILANLKQRGYGGFLTLEPHTVFYAKLKKVFALCPIVFFVPFLAKMRKAFRKIDKTRGIKMLGSVSSKAVFEWQHTALAELIK